MGHGGKREQQLGDGGGSWETTAAAGRARAAASGKEYVRSNKMILCILLQLSSTYCRLNWNWIVAPLLIGLAGSSSSIVEL